MKFLLSIALSLLLTVAAFAQPAPSGLTASHDGNGGVTLSWNAAPLGGQSFGEFIGWPTTPQERESFQHPNYQEARAAWNTANSAGELDEFIHYRIYRDGAQVGTSLTPSFTHQLGSPGTYEFYVTSFWDEGESDASNTVSVTWYDPDNWLLIENFDGGLPDTWTIEAHSPTETWHVDNGTDWGLFDTPYMLVDADGAGSCSHLQERLITPMLDFENADFAELTFSYVFNEYIQEHGYIDVRVEDGDWQNVYDISNTDINPVELTLDLTDFVADEEDVEICFFYDDDGNWGWYWGVDDVYVYRGGQAYPVILDITPTLTTVPPNGGNVMFDVEIENTLPTPFTDTQVWTSVVLPNGQTMGPIFSMPFPLSPYMLFFYVGFIQQVPAGAPAGTYLYQVHLGYNPQPSLVEEFPFVKLGANTDGTGNWQNPANWQQQLHPMDVAR